MTDNGDLVIINQFPRDALHNTGEANLVVSVTDHGTPAFDTSVSILVTVDSKLFLHYSYVFCFCIYVMVIYNKSHGQWNWYES